MNLNNKSIEKIKEINKILKVKSISLKVIDFINGEYQGAKTQVIIECSKHGLGSKFENAWIPSYNNLKNGFVCTKC